MEEGTLLRIFIGETDKHDGMALYEWIIQHAKQKGLAGATVMRAIEGYGSHSRIHTAKILQLSTDLPVVVEIIDTDERITALLPMLDEVLQDGLVTLDKIKMRVYKAKKG